MWASTDNRTVLREETSTVQVLNSFGDNVLSSAARERIAQAEAVMIVEVVVQAASTAPNIASASKRVSCLNEGCMLIV